MMKLLAVFYFFATFSVFGAVVVPEYQGHYDAYLDEAVLSLKTRLKEDAKSNADGVGYMYNDGSYRLWPYKYFLEGESPRGILVRAMNRSGKRTYIYDSYWNVVHYTFLCSEEAIDIGSRILKWVIEDNLSPSEVDELLDDLNWRGLITSGCVVGLEKYDVLGCIGDFLIYEDLREQIWGILHGGSVYLDDQGRELCVRSILSNFYIDEYYSCSLKREILMEVRLYLDMLRGKEGVRTDDIRQFLYENIEKGVSQEWR